MNYKNQGGERVRHIRQWLGVTQSEFKGFFGKRKGGGMGKVRISRLEAGMRLSRHDKPLIEAFEVLEKHGVNPSKLLSLIRNPMGKIPPQVKELATKTLRNPVLSALILVFWESTGEEGIGILGGLVAEQLQKAVETEEEEQEVLGGKKINRLGGMSMKTVTESTLWHKQAIEEAEKHTCKLREGNIPAQKIEDASGITIRVSLPPPEKRQRSGLYPRVARFSFDHPGMILFSPHFYRGEFGSPAGDPVRNTRALPVVINDVDWDKVAHFARLRAYGEE